MWETQPTDEFERKHKRWTKKHRRELAALLANVERYREALLGGVKPAQIRSGFVHPEPSGIFAVDQKGGGANLAESRLYMLPHLPTKTLFLLTLGDKDSQPTDIEWCKDAVKELLTIVAGEQGDHGEVGKEIQRRSDDDQGAVE